MKFKLLVLIISSMNQIGNSQNLNMIIEVNERLTKNEIAGVYLNFVNTNGTESRNLVGYHPGELVLQEKDWKKINSELTQKVTLTFDYYIRKGKLHNIINYRMEMPKILFKQRYLILRVYDFRERKFRKRYGCLTSENFIAEWDFPNSGILIGCQ